MNNLIFIELNELNFDFVQEYTSRYPGVFPSLENLLNGPGITTVAEEKYDELEPWIQWVSVHTGKRFSEHKVFRLGDIVGASSEQIFEKLEKLGITVGVISAMNADNRLVEPSYFIPDPWTMTRSDGSFWSRHIHAAIQQAVIDNASSRVSLKTWVRLFAGAARFCRVRHILVYIRLVMRARGRPWVKALILDLFLHDIHWRLFNRKKPSFSTLFLNGAAHIQHHYFFNSVVVKPSARGSRNPDWYVSRTDDPVFDALEIYDLILGEYIKKSGVEVLIATGLSQQPYTHEKFYYRLANHNEFLNKLGISFERVIPRMTRDFLVEFHDDVSALKAQKLLGSVKVSPGDVPLFGSIENRGNSLFVTLTYPRAVTKNTFYSITQGSSHPLEQEVVFVALKNGMHQSKGFVFFSKGFLYFAPANGEHVSSLACSIMKYFSHNEFKLNKMVDSNYSKS
jgi:hypothetical protein